MANDSRTYNAQVIASPFLNLSISGKVFTITERFENIGMAATANILFGVRDVPYSIAVHATATQNFKLDNFLVSSWSGGFVPNIANRNGIFAGITSIQAEVLADVVIEELVQPTPVLQRSVPRGPQGITIGGTFDVDVPIILRRNTTVVIQLTKAENLPNDLSDLYIVVHELGLNKDDLGIEGLEF